MDVQVTRWIGNRVSEGMSKGLCKQVSEGVSAIVSEGREGVGQ